MLKAGERLKEARLEKKLSLEEVSKTTKIKSKFLELIERGEYNKLPSVSYASGFVRNYARFLELPEKEILALFRREFDGEKAYKVLPKGLEAKEEFPLSRLKFKYTLILAILAFLFFFGFIAYQYRYAFINPPLEIVTPENGQVVNSSRVKVTGSTDPNSTIYINDVLVSVDLAGKFDKTFSVFPGKLILDIKAINRFGKKSEVKRTVEVKPAP